MNIFISYANEDSHTANDIIAILNKHAIEHFIDKTGIEWGVDFKNTIQTGLAKCTHIILIASPASLKSQWVAYEIALAEAQQKTILPFLTHQSLELPSFMNNLQWISDLETLDSFCKKSVKPTIKTNNTITLNKIKTVFIPMVISGDIDNNVFISFYNIIEDLGVKKPKTQMSFWVEDAKKKVALELNIPLAKTSFMDIDFTVKSFEASIEDCYRSIWDKITEQKKPSVSCMASLRLAMIGYFGEEVQKTLIKKWR